MNEELKVTDQALSESAWLSFLLGGEDFGEDSQGPSCAFSFDGDASSEGFQFMINSGAFPNQYGKPTA